MTPTRIASALLALGASALLIPAAAHAEESETVVRGERSDDVPVAYVKYGDLNLASAKGVDALRGRVRRAATSVCIERGTVDLARQMLGWRCRDAAVESAEPQITAAVERFGTSQVANAAPISVRMSGTR